MNIKTAIVITTINVPNVILAYAKNFEKFGHNKKNIDFIIVADIKTPKKAQEPVKIVSDKGFNAIYFSIDKQKKWMKKIPKLDSLIPYNSDNRRNLGYLLAKERRADIIINIDDDNWPEENKDYLSLHQIVGTTKNFKTFGSRNCWYNTFRHSKANTNAPLYPRGFPYSRRWKDSQKSYGTQKGKIAINAGLSLKDPDADAVTHLNQPVNITYIENNNYFLDDNNFTPINTQNSAFDIEMLPAYWYVRMGETIKGQRIDRYGDIWTGFFAQKVARHLGRKISFGQPATIHKRNSHNFLKDLQQELPGMILTEKLANVLENINPKGISCETIYANMADEVLNKFKKDNSISQEVLEYFKKINNWMKIWLKICNKI